MPPSAECPAHRRTRATPSPNGCYRVSTPASRSPTSGGMSVLTERGIKQRLKRALDTASSNPPSGLITPAPDGTPGRVSWLDPGGRLMHRPFDSAFPAHYTAEPALEQCRQVFFLLLNQPESPAWDRAYAMCQMAETSLQAFGHDAGRRLNDALKIPISEFSAINQFDTEHQPV